MEKWHINFFINSLLDTKVYFGSSEKFTKCHKKAYSSFPTGVGGWKRRFINVSTTQHFLSQNSSHTDAHQPQKSLKRTLSRGTINNNVVATITVNATERLRGRFKLKQSRERHQFHN